MYGQSKYVLIPDDLAGLPVEALRQHLRETAGDWLLSGHRREHAIHMGTILLALQSQVGMGHWLEYASREFGCSVRTLQRFMAMADAQLPRVHAGH